MNEKTLEKICAELASALNGRAFGKIFTLSRLRLAIDFRLPDSKYLFISIEPNQPRIHLIERRLRDLEKQTGNQTSFVMLLRKRLANGTVRSIEKLPNERILRIEIAARNDFDEPENYTLIVQLTGRSANLLLLDANDFVIDACRETRGDGQEIAGRYAAPQMLTTATRRESEDVSATGDFHDLSAALDDFHQRREAENLFQTRANAARGKLKTEIKKREKLSNKLRQDLTNHGAAETWKRFGDLILANLATAERAENKVSVTDFYDENTPLIEIEIDEQDSLTEAAERFFKKYTKARNAKIELSKRLTELNAQLTDLQVEQADLESAIERRDDTFFDDSAVIEPNRSNAKSRGKAAEIFRGARQYYSSEGFEILVGKGAKDNDYLTFRLAKASDLWLHAADYPGSHVIVRNPQRGEIPTKTLLEAAQAAAFFSHAKNQPKVAVHYTPKKFVNKPKGAAAGMVSMSSFKTILVTPQADFDER